jgi:hypothetical protein
MANNVIGLFAALKSGHEVVHAAEYRIGGKKIRNTTSGVKTICGRPGKSPNPIPARTRRIG